MYSLLWKEVELPIMAFPSTYLVEKYFSAVQQTTHYNRLDICEKGDLKLMQTSIEPDINSLVIVIKVFLFNILFFILVN